MKNQIIINIISDVSVYAIIFSVGIIINFFVSLHIPFKDEIKIRYKIYKLSRDERKQLGSFYFFRYFDISNLILFNLIETEKNRIENTEKYIKLIILNKDKLDLNFSSGALLKLEMLNIFQKNSGFTSVADSLDYRNKIRYGVKIDYTTDNRKDILNKYKEKKLELFSLNNMIKLEIAERCFKKMQMNFEIEKNW